jgi:hypothetical protein
MDPRNIDGGSDVHLINASTDLAEAPRCMPTPSNTMPPMKSIIAKRRSVFFTILTIQHFLL